MKPLMIRHLEGESIGRFPVWMMRQAGRFLPEYRAIRKEHSFWEMVCTPKIASEVSLLPINILNVDAVIFFSDILTFPYGMGLSIELKEGIGPVVNTPLRDRAAFDVFESYRPEKHTPFVAEAQKDILSKLSAEKALIGFAGAPWTVGTYLVEGRSSRQFENIKQWMYQDPESLAESLSLLGKATAQYYVQQAKAGVHALQLFDTWASEMPRAFFKQHYLPILNAIFASVRSYRLPLVYFAKHSAHLWDLFSELDVDVIGVDSLVPMDEVEKKVGSKFSLQGNLDSQVLLTSEANVRKQARQLVQTAQKLNKPPILNLGHGVIKTTPVENAKAFVQEAQTLFV